MEVCKTFYIKGRVQGVSFRYNTLKKANQLGLRGWVRNVIDGSVEVLAVGSEDKMDEFHKWLHKGPMLSRVISVDAKLWDTQEDLQNFIIGETGEPKCWAK